MVLSGKGGVGKTTTAVNLGASLNDIGQKVVVIDANIITPNVALQLGLPPRPNNNLNGALKQDYSIFDAVSRHTSGLDVIPAGLSIFGTKNGFSGNMREALSPLEEKYEIVIMDCGIGLWGSDIKTLNAADEVLIVTNPELPALIDSLKALKMAEKMSVPVRGIILNKVTGSSYELKDETVKGILNNYPIIAKIPFDKNVSKSLGARNPIVLNKPNSPAAHAFKRLAGDLVGEKYTTNIFWKTVNKFRGLA
ncbi:TPA: P-loop NTPase [archaeon]|nr:P-loop NTPase [Candidatus Undinarchaeales archaeon SRR5007147.bin71]